MDRVRADISAGRARISESRATLNRISRILGDDSQRGGDERGSAYQRDPMSGEAD